MTTSREGVNALDIYENKIDESKFRSTNYIWNELKLNSPWAVGYVTTLIESKEFKCREDWKDFYYKSGKDRLDEIIKLNPKEANILRNFSIKDNTLPYELKNLNYSYGRTENDLIKLAKCMYKKILEEGNPNKIDLGECVYMVKYRVLGETWNGVRVREINTVKELNKAFPDVSFVKTAGDIDYKYGVDYELYHEDKRLCAIQIKPSSYRNGKSIEIQKAKKANEFKNKLYEDDFSAKVLYVYSSSNGIIENKEVISQIRSFKKHIFFDNQIDYKQCV
ncbi:MAG: hypothetical protein K0R54_246 [Clostridiaceae bacterium]|nr:hypothetical protein [Clostridiaceae bacterium]